MTQNIQRNINVQLKTNDVQLMMLWNVIGVRKSLRSWVLDGVLARTLQYQTNQPRVVFQYNPMVRTITAPNSVVKYLLDQMNMIE